MLKSKLVPKIMKIMYETRETKEIPVQCWDKIGLCIHKEDSGLWVVSHYLSGCYIIKVDTREKAIRIMGILKTVCPNWNKSKKELMEVEKNRYDFLNEKIRELKKKFSEIM